ncbi:hypothetical protein BCR35DRAFT_352960 [Leucosporidium creatinivorum]|uniref:Uncharacterized protein n=1 Tax=Leucosporidium creatinivorum TaxID=106004 RepID=A0A1Y2F3K4_9BASI|nr:hypothetical protein BCR35DRAFT_352960 [Leucosporidium creatinivorum]
MSRETTTGVEETKLGPSPPTVSEGHVSFSFAALDVLREHADEIQLRAKGADVLDVKAARIMREDGRRTRESGFYVYAGDRSSSSLSGFLEWLNSSFGLPILVYATSEHPNVLYPSTSPAKEVTPSTLPHSELAEPLTSALLSPSPAPGSEELTTSPLFGKPIPTASMASHMGSEEECGEATGGEEAGKKDGGTLKEKVKGSLTVEKKEEARREEKKEEEVRAVGLAKLREEEIKKVAFLTSDIRLKIPEELEENKYSATVEIEKILVKALGTNELLCTTVEVIGEGSVGIDWRGDRPYHEEQGEVETTTSTAGRKYVQTLRLKKFPEAEVQRQGESTSESHRVLRKPKSWVSENLPSASSTSTGFRFYTQHRHAQLRLQGLGLDVTRRIRRDTEENIKVEIGAAVYSPGDRGYFSSSSFIFWIFHSVRVPLPSTRGSYLHSQAILDHGLRTSHISFHDLHSQLLGGSPASPSSTEQISPTTAIEGLVTSLPSREEEEGRVNLGAVPEEEHPSGAKPMVIPEQPERGEDTRTEVSVEGDSREE